MINETTPQSENSNPFYILFLQEEFTRRKAVNFRYSLRAFARFLEVEPSTICRMFAGKQQISLKLARHLVNKLKIEEPNKSLFLSSVLEEKQKTLLRKLQMPQEL